MLQRTENLLVIFAIIINFGIFAASEIARPRGVAISKSPLYQPGDTFVCLDGTKTISWNQVNDDFCDCLEDGSDEPGTNACSNGFFHCTNAGHKPKNIPSSMVNDGICDCCDAADEYNSQAQCINNCSDLGKEDRVREKHRAETAKMGNQYRAEMAQRGKSMKDEQKIRMAQLEKSKQESESLRSEKEKIKSIAEGLENAALDVYREMEEAQKRIKDEEEAANDENEAKQTFYRFDSNQDGYIEVIELQTRMQFDRNHDGVITTGEAKFFLDDHDRVDMETFLTLAYPKMKPFLMLDAGLFKPPVTAEEIEEGADDEDAGEEEEQQQNVEEQIDEPEDVNPFEDEDEGTEGEDGEEVGEGDVEAVDSAKPHIEYDPETQKLIEEATESRNQFNTADREYRDILKEIKDLEDKLDKDFGPEEEFAPLHGECFNFEDREYVYKLCPFDRAVQQPKSGGAETR